MLRKMLLVILFPLVAISCQNAASYTVDLQTKSRPLGVQVVLGGDVVLDHNLNKILPENNSTRVTRRSARPPLWGLYEILKGPNHKRLDTVSLVSLASPLGKGETAGKSTLAEVLVQAAIDGVTLANQNMTHASSEEIVATQKSLERARVPALGVLAADKKLTTHTYSTASGVKIGWAALYLSEKDSFQNRNLAAWTVQQMDAALEGAKESVEHLAQQGADFVVLAVGFPRGVPFERRQKTLRRLADETSAGVIWSHHPGEIEGLENRNGKLLVYNLGPTFLTETDTKKQASILLKLHLSQRKLAWVELQPITLKAGRSRIGMGKKETYDVIARMVAASEKLQTQLSVELGRGILEM